jgi:hypothetical protein
VAHSCWEVVAGWRTADERPQTGATGQSPRPARSFRTQPGQIRAAGRGQIGHLGMLPASRASTVTCVGSNCSLSSQQAHPAGKGQPAALLPLRQAPLCPVLGGLCRRHTVLPISCLCRVASTTLNRLLRIWSPSAPSWIAEPGSSLMLLLGEYWRGGRRPALRRLQSRRHLQAIGSCQ